MLLCGRIVRVRWRDEVVQRPPRVGGELGEESLGLFFGESAHLGLAVTVVPCCVQVEESGVKVEADGSLTEATPSAPQKRQKKGWRFEILALLVAGRPSAGSISVVCVCRILQILRWLHCEDGRGSATEEEATQSSRRNSTKDEGQ